VRGLDLKSSGIYGMLPFIAMAIASPLGGFVADRLTAAKDARWAGATASAALAVAALFVALATQVADARLATLFLAGGAGALYMSQSAFWTISANLGGRSAGSVSGVMNMANQIGGVVTASLTPWLADGFGWTASFVFAACLSLLGALAWLSSIPKTGSKPPICRTRPMRKLAAAFALAAPFALTAPAMSAEPEAGAYPAPAPASDPMVDEFNRVEASSVADAMEQLYGMRNYLPHQFRPNQTTKFTGRALTVYLKREEHEEGSPAQQGMIDAIDAGAPGSVYVMAMDGAGILPGSAR
jgi:MFS family permease